jgi:prepilin-type N-terminal cleavage/methylation domain-containing protein
MNHFRYKQGMTLVEMLVTIALMTILMGMIFSSIYYFYRYNAYAIAQTAEVDNARRSLTRLTRDIREMTYAEDGSFPIVVKEPHRLGFYSDIDYDNSVEYVEYELATTTFFKRTYNAVGTPPVYNLANPDEEIIVSEFVQNNLEATSTFAYFNSNGVVLAAGDLLTDVRFIQVQIIVNVNPIQAPGEFLLRTSIAPRNLKDNL